VINNLTICFVTLERFDFLKRSVESVKGFDSIIIYDNGTRSKNKEYLIKATAKKNKATYIRSKTNDGLPKAWNQCIIESKTDWVCLCPDDFIFAADWKESLERILEIKPHVKFIAGNNYDCLILHKSLIPITGWLEERYQGGVSAEDYDFHLRLTEKIGFSPYVMPGDHVVGHEREVRLKRKITKEQFYDKRNFTYWCNSEFSEVGLLGEEIPHKKDDTWNKWVEKGNTPGYAFHDLKWELCTKQPAADGLLNIDGQFWRRIIEDIDPYPKITAEYKERYK
jgi:glycosyltransferase involved in cell wall biosynthesis